MPLDANIAAWVGRIRSGDARALARALSEVENRGARAESLLTELFEGSKRAWRIGVTGAPGAGKSTLVNQLAAKLRAEGRTVAILAVDPTSPFTGGALLGDRVRMLSHSADDGVFIRSMAARGSLGGLAPTTADLITVLEAAGRDVVILETVGVGQAEVDVVKLSSAVVVVLTPTMGDDVQALKAGVMEIADVYALNKADLPGADRVVKQLEAMLSLRPPSDDPAPAIVRTVAPRGEGIDDLLAALEARPARTSATTVYWKHRLLDDLRRNLAERLLPPVLDPAALERAAEDAASGRLNPYTFVGEVVAEIERRLRS